MFETLPQHRPKRLCLLIVLCALTFDFINGFHDTANAIATVVSTRVLTLRKAILMWKPAKEADLSRRFHAHVHDVVTEGD